MTFFRRREHRSGPIGNRQLSTADRVWNRAALESGGRTAGPADTALAAMLSIHNIAMNGGLLHSIQHHTEEELDRGVEGYEYFGLADAAAVVAWVRAEAARLDHNVERLEFEADRRYADVVPDDSTLATRFEEHFRRHPDAYAPL